MVQSGASTVIHINIKVELPIRNAYLDLELTVLKLEYSPISAAGFRKWLPMCLCWQYLKIYKDYPLHKKNKRT